MWACTTLSPEPFTREKLSLPRVRMLTFSLGTAESGIEKKSRHMCCTILEDFGVKNNFGVVSFKLRKKKNSKD